MTLNFTAYSALEVPQPIHGTTDPEVTDRAYEEGEALFGQIRRALFLAGTKYDGFFDIITSREAFQDYRGPGSGSGTTLESYRLNGYQTLLTVWDERDDFNFHNIFFLKHALTDRTKEFITRAQTAHLAPDHSPRDL